MSKKNKNLKNYLETIPDSSEVKKQLSTYPPLDLEDKPEDIKNKMVVHFLETVIEVMEKKGMTKIELAKRINKSRQYVSKMFNENNNFTIKTISEVSHALNLNPHLIFKSVEINYGFNVFRKKKKDLDSDYSFGEFEGSQVSTKFVLEKTNSNLKENFRIMEESQSSRGYSFSETINLAKSRKHSKCCEQGVKYCV